MELAGILMGAALLMVLVILERMMPGKCESPIEERMKHALEKENLKPFCQKRVGPYRIDLAVVMRGVKIAVECDGKAYHSSPEQRRHDRKKDRYLQKRGWIVLRFSGTRIHREAGKCAEEVVQALSMSEQQKWGHLLGLK